MGNFAREDLSTAYGLEQTRLGKQSGTPNPTMNMVSSPDRNAPLIDYDFASDSDMEKSPIIQKSKAFDSFIDEESKEPGTLDIGTPFSRGTDLSKQVTTGKQSSVNEGSLDTAMVSCRKSPDALKKIVKP